MPESDGSYHPDSAEQLRQLMIDELEERIDDPATNEGDIIYGLLDTIATVKEDTQEQSLSDLADQAFLDTSEGEALTRKAEEYGVQRQPAVSAEGVLEFSRNSVATTDYPIPSGTRVRTEDESVEFVTTETTTLENGETEVEVNAEASDGGSNGNLPSNKLVSLVSSVAGIDSVTNIEPTGNDEFENTDGDPLTVGQDEENDEDLRDRVYDATSLGGAATPSAIREALEEVPEIRSYGLEINHTGSIEDGLDPYSMEFIIDGGSENDIAEALYDSLSIVQLLRLQSGVNGTSVSHNVQSDILDQTVQVVWSEPTEVTIEVEADLVVDDNYIGNEELGNRIVEYTGGQRSDGTNASGLSAGMNVYEDRIRNILTDDDTNVIGITDLILDDNNDGNDDTEMDSNSLSVINIENNETSIIDFDDIDLSTEEFE